MDLPEYVSALISRLEQAGFPTYAVGGCVRDACLGLPPQDYDLCTAATPEQIKSVFQDFRMFLAGEKHGTISLVTDQGIVEITTFRTESGYSDHRRPDRVVFVPGVEADLARRDFTINAMAYASGRGMVDPFGGRQDLENRILRTVGDPAERFQEDPLRILRGVRFSVRFGLTPDPATLHAMTELSPLMESLARERVFDELCKLLPLATARDLLTFAPVLTQVIPELAPALGFDQHSPHHAYDVYTHTAHVVQATPPDLVSRWAALLHDVGKPAAFTMDGSGRGHFYGHAEISARISRQILLRLKAPGDLREQVVWIIAHHMTPLEPDRTLLRRRLRQYGPEATRLLLIQQQADYASKGVHDDVAGAKFAAVEQLLKELLAQDLCFQRKDLAISGRDLLDLGYSPGKALGDTLNRLLDLVVDEKLPNTRDALLAQAAKMRENP